MLSTQMQHDVLCFELPCYTLVTLSLQSYTMCTFCVQTVMPDLCCRQQLVSHLGQATADEVFALRANTPAPLTKPPASQPTAAELAAKQSAVPSEQTDAPATAQHASQQVADTHNAKPTSVVADSQSAESAVQATPQQASSPTANDTNVIGAEAVKPEPAVIPKNAPATAPPTVSSAQRKTAGKPIVASVPSNPRFAPRPVAPESGAMEPQAVAKEVDRAPEGGLSVFATGAICHCTVFILTASML